MRRPVLRPAESALSGIRLIGTGLIGTGLIGVLLLSSCAQDPEPDVMEEPVSQESLEEFLVEQEDVLAEEAVVMVLQEGEVHTATTDGADEHTLFELASLSKPMTGMLLADAVDRGEVGLEDALAEHLPDLEGTEAGEITLEELATHTSGLPLVPDADGFAQQDHQARQAGENPYEVSTEELISLAAEQGVGDSGRYIYSNLGIALLGHALAESAGMTYEELLQERLTEPLGMDETTTSDAEGHPSDEDLIQGYDSSGEVEDFGSEAFSPASSSRATPEDYMLMIEAIFEGTAPGAESVEPSDINPDMGLGWHLKPEGYAWHNGISNGYASLVALDPDTETAVLLFSNYGVENSELGMDLLQDILDAAD